MSFSEIIESLESAKSNILYFKPEYPASQLETYLRGVIDILNTMEPLPNMNNFESWRNRKVAELEDGINQEVDDFRTTKGSKKKKLEDAKDKLIGDIGIIIDFIKHKLSE